MKLENLKHKKIAILGLGINNQGLASFLKSNSIDFDVLEWDSLEELSSRILDYELVFRTPGLPMSSEPIKKALDAQVAVYSQTKLFFDICPGRIIGVTGTKGKGTTATLIYLLLKAFKKDVYLAGNIGQDPFKFISDLNSDSITILELSSFQLQDLHQSPYLAVVLNITSEHLDYHTTVEEYRDAKKSIVAHQSKDDFCVLNYDYDLVRSFVDLTPAQIYWNSTEQEVKPGAYVNNDKIFLTNNNSTEVVMDTDEVGLTGFFNLENVTAAVSALVSMGLDNVRTIRSVIKEFKGLEHRLEFVREKSGIKFYNDSFSTTPETAIAAISAFTEPIILIVGGSEKGSDYTDLGKKIATSKVKALIPIGTTGRQITEQAKKKGFRGRVIDKSFESMEEIVAEAYKNAESGDVIILSPASASFDMFSNYKQRGEKFKSEVSNLQ